MGSLVSSERACLTSEKVYHTSKSVYHTRILQLPVILEVQDDFYSSSLPVGGT